MEVYVFVENKEKLDELKDGSHSLDLNVKGATLFRGKDIDRLVLDVQVRSV